MSEVRLDAGGNCTIPGSFLAGSQGGLTATAGGGQAKALQLTGQQASVTTVANQGDSVRLPQAIIGQNFDLQNAGSQPMQVYGFGTDTINAIATATGISHGAGIMATYMCVSAGKWVVQFGWSQQQNLIPITTSASISGHVSHSYIISAGSALSITLGNPTSGTDDGITISFNSKDSQVHQVSNANFICSVSAADQASFPGTNGGSFSVMAYQGKWIVQAAIGVTFASV